MGNVPEGGPVENRGRGGGRGRAQTTLPVIATLSESPEERGKAFRRGKGEPSVDRVYRKMLGGNTR